MAWGLIFNLWLCLPGALMIIGGIYGWVLEPSTAPEDDHGHGDHGPGDGPDPVAPDSDDDASATVDAEAEEAAPVD